MPDESPAILSLEEAAVYLRIKESALVRMARDQKIGSLKMGRTTVFPRAVLEAYVELHTIKPVTNPWGFTDASLRRVRGAQSRQRRAHTEQPRPSAGVEES